MSTLPLNATVWSEIPVTDIEKSIAFYKAVTGYPLELDTSGPNPMAVFASRDLKSAASGHLYPGTPAARGTGPTVHLAVTGTVEDAIKRVSEAGGEVVSPPIDIPAGRFAYCLDLDGNSFGVFTGKA